MRAVAGAGWPSSLLAVAIQYQCISQQGCGWSGSAVPLLVVTRFLIYFLSKTDLPINDRCLTIEDSRASLYTGTNDIFTLIVSLPFSAHRCIAFASSYLPCLDDTDLMLLVLASVYGCSGPGS